MTDEEARDLGVRVWGCEGWVILPGMVDCDGVRVLRVGKHTIDAFNPHARGGGAQFMMRGDRLGPPDFRDPATLGCLLALVRKAINPGVHATRWSDGSWSAMDPDNDENEEITLAFSSEAEALIVALEAAR